MTSTQHSIPAAEPAIIVTLAATRPLPFASIKTAYLGPTNHKGGRVKATCQARSITRQWDYSLNTDENHRAVAAELAQLVGWRGEWHMGGDHGTSGYTFVCSSGVPAFTVREA